MYYIKLMFLFDGDCVVCGLLDNDVYVWDVRDASASFVAFDGYIVSVSCVYWLLMDFYVFVLCCDDGEIRLWCFDGV